jgi:hypothetical protein
MKYSGTNRICEQKTPNTTSCEVLRDVDPIPSIEQPELPTPGLGGGTLRGAFSNSLRGLELVPAKWHSLVPFTSGYRTPLAASVTLQHINALRILI